MKKTHETNPLKSKPMIQAVITYDLFRPDSALMTVEYNIFDKVTETTSIKIHIASTQVETRVRHLICDGIERMVKQRNENYRYGETWNGKASRAIFELPSIIATARQIKDLVSFSHYLETEILPRLYQITPSQQSRFYPRFKEKVNLIISYIEYIQQNPGFCDVLNHPRKARKTA